jgi:uncharacterized protein GlcG (DUF336 family)
MTGSATAAGSTPTLIDYESEGRTFESFRARGFRLAPQGFTLMQGGLPIVVDGEVIGAIGAIGAIFDTPEHDVQIAQAGLVAVPH